MSARARLLLFVVGAGGFALLFLWGLRGLPPVGDYRGPYGDILNRVAVPQRHVTDVVAAVNFDYRGLDTVGEEFILFVSVAGVAQLLRTERGERKEQAPPDQATDHGERASDAIRALCLLLAAPTALFGLYVVTHGQLTPGGGFQGGAILASALLLIYLSGEYRTMRALAPTERVEAAEAAGAAAFVLIGVAGLIAGTAFLQNIVPLGPVGAIYSAGTIPLINLSVGLEVGAGFLLILSTFMEQTLQVREQGGERHNTRDERSAR